MPSHTPISIGMVMVKASDKNVVVGNLLPKFGMKSKRISSERDKWKKLENSKI